MEHPAGKSSLFGCTGEAGAYYGFIRMNAGLGGGAPLEDGICMDDCPLCDDTEFGVHLLVHCGSLK